MFNSPPSRNGGGGWKGQSHYKSSFLATQFLFALSALFGLINQPRDFASYMLGIFICNLLLYLAFYIIMKVRVAAGSAPWVLLRWPGDACSLAAFASHPQLRSSEKILLIPLFCIVATAVVWAAALYFFFQNLSSWEVREECLSPGQCALSILLFWPSYLPLFTGLLLFIFFIFSNVKAFLKGVGFI